MAQKQVIDVHCHLFSARYAVMELAAATWNHLQGSYPHAGGEAGIKAFRGPAKPLDGVKEFAAWIARLLDVSVSDGEGNFNTARNCFAKSALGKDASLIVTPLMMDIYFALWDNADEETTMLKAGRSKPAVAAFAVSENQKKDFDAHFDMIRKLVTANIRRQTKTGRFLSAGRTRNDVFEDAKRELLAVPLKLRRGVDPYDGIELSPGYKHHLLELEALAGKYPRQVQPFLAVDPRRIGIMKLVEMKINKGKGVFKGVKIYPPLGYLPTHPNLEAVFEYCERYDVPVTAHCSPGGMQNFRGKNYVVSGTGDNHWEDFQTVGGSKSRFYTAPEKWLPVLAKFPNLRINFAHLGGGDQLAAGETAWMKDIITMIRNHALVYTDVSYHTQKELPGKILKIVRQNECLANKLMFGTDYIMIMLDRKLGGLARYFNFYTSFTDKLLHGNAKDFLKL
ncbi:MAG: hypothetical protein EG826_11500 [Deltaproteobacteria bacterium]|nr:hypothetical protein [Deltaproteobacteria bacterium]